MHKPKNSSPLKVGIVGCGNISSIYCQKLKEFAPVELVVCADLDLARAESRSKEYSIPRACSTAELLADPGIDIVVNLTIPAVHAAVSIAALDAGKHVYSEKPLSVNRNEGKKIIDTARKKGLYVGCAPDTVLGAGIQTCRQIIDAGAIGKPVAACAFMMCAGHESWHPAPEFYYQVGGGPVFDMGPYYLTALVTLLGPVKRVTGSAKISFPTRTITSQPLNGKIVQVEVPTHVAGVLEFENGAVVTMIMSFDVQAHTLPNIQIYGAAGTIEVPDPNGFGGKVRIKKRNENWSEQKLTHGCAENSRGLGVAEMALAILEKRDHRASGELAFHVLDIMESLHESSNRGKHVVLQSSCRQPAPLPADFEKIVQLST